MDPANQFPTTQWSVVLKMAEEKKEPDDSAAIARFFRTYWRPVEAFIRSMGVPKEDAEDLAQELFAAIDRMDQYARLDPEKGRMRGYLRTLAKHRVYEFHRNRNRKKRGGGEAPLPLEEHLLSDQYSGTEKEFDRQWALRLLALTANHLEQKYRKRDRLPWFRALFPVITQEGSEASHAEIAAELDSSVGAVKVALHRLKEKYRLTLREEVAKTVVSENEVDEEIAALFNALSHS